LKQKFIDLYMDWATRTAQLSHAQRLNVGAVIVKDDTVISYGYNGMPAGWDNTCEIEEHYEDGSRTLTTRPEVLHAESNAIAKLARGHNSGERASIFVTHSPCLECAKLIYQSGISQVYYRLDYRDASGVAFLQQSGIEVTKC